MTNEGNGEKTLKQRMIDWLRQQSVTIRKWMVNRLVLAAAGFMGLNAVDGYLSNHAAVLARQLGITQTVEANPFLQPIMGNWIGMGVKGLLTLAVFGLVSRLSKVPQRAIIFALMLGCLALAAAISWNLWVIFG